MISLGETTSFVVVQSISQQSPMVLQIEEEEYTSRIIQYFSTGLLTLPDGATLRSYLAEKLNCDPMRITKKFTGACCLGRRAYHLRDRPRASPAEIEMATFELLHLEQRFRLRVEHEQTGLPLPPRHELLASQPTSAAAVVPSLFTLPQGAPAVKATNPWIQNPVIPSQAHHSLLSGLTGIIPNAAVSSAKANLNLQNSSSLLLAAGQLLLQNPSERFVATILHFIYEEINFIYLTQFHNFESFIVAEHRLATHQQQQQPLSRC